MGLIYSNISLHRYWIIEKYIEVIDFISVWPEYRIEGTSDFNTGKETTITNIEEHDLDTFVTSMIEDPTTIVGIKNYKKNQEKEKRIIYDFLKGNLMVVITPLKTTKECFDTLTNIYEKKARTQKSVLKNKLKNMKMEKNETVAIMSQIFHWVTMA